MHPSSRSPASSPSPLKPPGLPQSHKTEISARPSAYPFDPLTVTSHNVHSQEYQPDPFSTTASPKNHSPSPHSNLLLPPGSAPMATTAHLTAYLTTTAPAYLWPPNTTDEHRTIRPPFSGPNHYTAELLHTPWRIPTSMATARLSPQLSSFYAQQLDPLARRPVHPASHVLLTKTSPLRRPVQRALTQVDTPYTFKVCNLKHCFTA